MTSYIRVNGSRIAALAITDGPKPEDDAWIDAGDWVGFGERPAPGWQPHWVGGKVVWRDESASSERTAAAWAEVRRQRTALLTASDWTQLPDVPTETSDRWVAYRQALRDVTDQHDPFSIAWPAPPS